VLSIERENVSRGGALGRRVILDTTKNKPLPRRRTESISFRLDKDILAELKREAEQKQVNLNTLANQIFDYYVKFANSAKTEMIPVTKATIMELVQRCSDDELKSIAERVFKKVSTDIAFQLRGKADFEAGIDILEYYLKATGVPYKHTIDEHNKNRHTFIVQYGMGRKWSFYVAESVRAAFEPVLAKEAEYTITDNIIAITVEGKD
jgi:hypothetical protein